MKTLKTKISLVALMIALVGAGVAKVNASELYRPDKQSGKQISITDCQPNPAVQCGLLYEDGEDQPFDAVNGDYTGN